LVVVIVAILLIVFKIATLKNKEVTGSRALPYFKKKTLLNEKEQVLFHRLVEAMPNCYVMAQVRLADIVGIKKTKNWQSWFNKISRKSVDFVICNKSLVVLACIELDGKTHEQENRQKADGDKDAALNAAEIPIIRIEASKLASTDEIKALLEKALLH
jgi:very-short-patch-repair endonuclease